MKNLKKMSLLIALKIIEIAAIIFIPYHIGKFTTLKIVKFNDITNLFMIWFLGVYSLIVIILLILVLLMISLVISEWFKLNLKLIDRIIK